MGQCVCRAEKFPSKRKATAPRPLESPSTERRQFVTRKVSVPPQESLRHLLKLHIQSQLRFAGPGTAVKLPRGASESLWIDIHVVDFVNEVATMWSLVEATCSTRCGEAQMSAGTRRLYTYDGCVLCAVDYARRALAEARETIDDAKVFPVDEDTDYPPEFSREAKLIVTRLFHIYAHIYHAHFSALVALRCDQVVNELFRRFVLFALEFDLIDRFELEPLDELIRNLFHANDAAPATPTRDHVDDDACSTAAQASGTPLNVPATPGKKKLLLDDPPHAAAPKPDVPRLPVLDDDRDNVPLAASQ